MSEFVTQNVFNDFQRDGVVCIRNVFNDHWIQTIRRGIERNLDNPSPYSEKLFDQTGSQKGVYFNDYCNWRSIPEFKEFIYNSPAAEISGLLMDSENSMFYHEHVLIKEADTGKETPWHHDQSYYPIDGFKNCSIWMPLDSVPIDCALELAAGSHLGDIWYKPRKFATHLNYANNGSDESSQYNRQYFDVPSDQYIRQNYNILRYAVEPGDCIVFHMRVLHSAPGNPSKSISRRVLSTRWLGDDSTIGVRPWITSPPTTGGLNTGQNVKESPEFPIIWKRSL